MPGVTGSTGRKAKLLLRRGGITVLCERNAGASDNPTLKQKSTNTFQSQSHTSSCQGGRLEISAALSRSCGLGVFPRSLIVGSMAESYHHITECPTYSVFSPDGGRAPGAGTLAQDSRCLFWTQSSLSRSLCWLQARDLRVKGPSRPWAAIVRSSGAYYSW